MDYRFHIRLNAFSLHCSVAIFAINTYLFSIFLVKLFAQFKILHYLCSGIKILLLFNNYKIIKI